MGHGSSPKMTITADEAVLRCDRAEGVLKVFLRNSVVDMGGISMVWPDVQEREIPLSDASRARSGGPRTNLRCGTSPAPSRPRRREFVQHEQMMAALAACEMTCGDFDELTSEQWRAYEYDKGELVVALLSPALRAAAPLGGRLRLLLLCPGRRSHGDLPPQPRLSHQFLPLLPADPDHLLPADDLRRPTAKNGTLPTIFVWAGNIMLLLLGGFWLLRRVSAAIDRFKD